MTVYDASLIKRARATKADMEARYQVLLDICSEMYPITVRGVFYQASSKWQIVEKTESGYDMVQRALVDLRRRGRLPYGWIADNTRWTIRPDTYRNAGHALREIARFYRKRLWDDISVRAEIWIEKDALSAVVSPVTEEFDVPLMVTRGYASLTFLHNAAEHIKAIGKPTFIYHFGDFDPSGVDAARKVERELKGFAPDVPITFKQLAVLPEQIAAWNLPTRPTKKTDTRSKGFSETSVELDAIDPNRLRQLVRSAIELHLPQEQFELLKVAEESEREFLVEMARFA